MEAVPRLPMISFELKISPDRPPTDFGKLKQYIRDFYNEDPDTYSTEIHHLETLRATAVRPAREVDGCTGLKKYFCQLHFLQSRFPMGKDGAAAVAFTWRDAYAGMVCTLADIRFEMVAILHNIGALHSQLGAADNRTSAEGLKLACTHFQCAAWAFQHLKDSYPQPAGVDVSPDLMQFMQQICLAQAQECILEKSMTDNRKATINAKVAAQIVDYYNMALNALVLTGGADDGCILETVGAKIFKMWKKYVKFKLTYYGCISLLYLGMQSEEQQKMGERVAYFQAAFDKLTEAIRLSKGLDQPEAVAETLAFTMDVVEGKRKAAKNENEYIYHEKVPEKDELPDVKGAALVKGIPFSLNDPDISGPDIFSKLVPMKAHEASSMYSEEKAKLLRKVGGMLDEKDQELVGFMSSLQLEHVNASLEPDILPQELIDRCAALSAKPDAIQNLIDAMDRLSGLYHDVDAMLKEILEFIKIEEAAEKEYQEVMGTRPPSIVATDLTREANKYKEAHTKAAESNETLHKAMAQHIANLRVMSLPLSELHKQLPSLSALNLEDNKTLKELRMLLGKVDEMRRQRSMFATQLRESVCSDDITALLVTRPSENLQSVFDQEIHKHDRYVNLIEQNLSAQGKILKALTDAYADFTDTRKAIAEIIRQRNLILTALMSSYDAYEDLIAKSNKGLEFYRKLETNVTKLLQRVKGTCKVQEEEREQILIKNGKQLPSKKLENVNEFKNVPSTGGGLKLKDYLQNMKKEGGVYTVTNPSNTVQPGPYNPNHPNYGTVQTPSTVPSQTAGYPDPLSSNTDGTQPWVPSVRPAPVGSEGSSTNKVPDMKTDISQNYTYPPSNYPGYDPQYYYRTAQTPGGYNQAYYNTVKPESALPTSVATTSNNLNYQQQTQTPNSSSTTPNLQYNSATYPTYPAANYQSNNADTGKYANQYVPSQQGYGSTQTNYQPVDYYQNSSIQGYQHGYPVTNSGNPQVSVGYSVPTPGYNSTSASPNHSVDQNKTNVLPNTAYSQPTTSVSTNVQGYTSTVTANTAYATPTTYANQTGTQYSTNPNQSGYVYPSQAANSYQYGENYQHSGNVSYNWQRQNLSAQQPQQVQSVPQQPVSQVQPPTPSPSPNPPQTGTGYSSEQKWNQQNQYVSYNNTPTVNSNAPYSGSYANAYTGVPSSNAVMPPSTVTPDASQYPSHSYYPPSYPQQYQYPAVPGTSHYTHATQQIITSQTNSSQTSVQGQTFAAQYNGPTQTNQPPSLPTDSAQTAAYYAHQYGYQLPQYNSPNGGGNSQVVSPVEPSQVTPMSPMTYMQASANSTLKMTYSQQHTNGSKHPNGSTTEDKKETSNVDLLAGLDFSVNETPLVPEPSNQDKPPPPSVPKSSSEVKPVKETEEIKIEEKLASMSLQSSTADLPVKKEEPPPIVPLVSKEDKTKCPPKDPFLDPDVLGQFVTEVEKFEKFVDGLTSKTLNGPTPLDIKWKELLDIQDKDSQKLISVARCYPMKNRFPDILPYDVSRVELPSTKDDYINASHVKNISSNCPNFIVTQSPLPSTYSDFWTMVLEQQVEIVVCLLNDMEIKDNVYWPAVKGQEEKVGRVTVNLQSTNVRKHWVERIISVTDGRLARNIVHLQFTEWPGSSFPASPGPFLSLAGETLSLWNQQRGSGPIVVHCVAGVGRSGLFIVSTAAICEIQAGHGLPDIISLAASVSSYRKNALHDREHFKFSYLTLLYFAQDLLMKRGILASRSSFEEKRPKSSHTRHPSQDFLLGPPKEVNCSGNNEPEGAESANNVINSSEERNVDDPFKQIDPMWPIKRFQ